MSKQQEPVAVNNRRLITEEEAAKIRCCSEDTLKRRIVVESQNACRYRRVVLVIGSTKFSKRDWEVTSRKARRPATDLVVNRPHVDTRAGEPDVREAKSLNRFCPLAVYDGTALAGSIVERAGKFVAYNVNNHRIGTFVSLRDAMRAIPAVRS